MNEVITTLKEVLLSIEQKPSTAWVYLPQDKEWNLESRSAVLQSEEVPPELEDEPDAGIPEIAKANGLMQALPVTVVQDIVRNIRAQKPDATIVDLFRAFEFYYQHDAFINLQ
jgi:hypothetical protein